MIAIHAVERAFSPDECDRIAALAAGSVAQEARLVGANRDHNLRRASLVWLDDVPGAEWVMDRLIDLVRVANRDVFDFDLRDFAESPQVAQYDAGVQGHFDWHGDVGDGPLASRRKITTVVQLSRPEGYAGGALEVMPSAHVRVAARDQGAALMFPGFLLHRVTPVTEGSRRSLTVWAHGPAFR